MTTKHHAAEAPSSRSRRRQVQDPYFSKVVGKALDILEVLKRHPKPLSLNDVTQLVHGAKTSVFRILRTLEIAGYIERDAAGRYLLSAEVRALLPGPFLNRLIRFTHPKLKELNRAFHETVSLAVHASSLGKSILAFQTEERRDKLLLAYGLHRFTPHTITDQRDLRREFEQIAERGYATDMEESTPDGCCIGAPILGEDGHAIASISISFPKSRMGDEKKIAPALQRTCAALARELKE